VTMCHDERCTTVTLTDWCACGSRAGEPTLLDLSDAAFRDLAPLSAGVIEVTIAVEGPRMTLPPTDTLPSEPRRELHSRVL
jgi:expansin (peptidoglycan-binding protein)